MSDNKAIIITTINYPTLGVKKLAQNFPDWQIIVVGDRKTPADWHHSGVQFLPVEQQLKLDSAYAQKCPLNHYARKNIGYLKAIQAGVQIIFETDDDNIPYDFCLDRVDKSVMGRLVEKQGWENVYTHFSDAKIWPRGLPLEYLNQSFQQKSPLGNLSQYDCPIQQHLADGDPDVDAVYRLTTVGEIKFKPETVVLADGTFCPFNSQNTIWWPEAYPLLYLPSFVSFRMTDIWRSFVAQICLYKLGKNIAFKEATVYQERNEHSLIRDFADEIPGYLHNTKIMTILADLELSDKLEHTGNNLRCCYQKLVEAEIIPPDELNLIDLWLEDLAKYTSRQPDAIEVY
jgi:hypothetical protein